MVRKTTSKSSKPEYPYELRAHICELVAEGLSLSEILRRKGMPSLTTFWRWLDADEEHRANYARARETSADVDADKIGDIAAKVVKGTLDPQAARVAIDAYKWTAGKRKPKVYGDKLDLSGRIGLTVVLDSDADKL